MKRTNTIHRLACAAIAGAALLLILCGMAAAQQLGQWTRFDLDGGGVAHDIQLLKHDDASPVNNEIWSVSMSSGYYRATWSSGSGWSNWTAYQPGKSGLGVDAIEVSGTEHVMVGTGGHAVQYCNNPTAASPTWDWPNGYTNFPALWRFSRVHDAAFYWPDGSNPTNPEGEYFFILAANVYNNVPALVAVPGIYRWTGSSPDYFARVDESGWTSTKHTYWRFYRDIDHPNILYVTSPEGIFKLSAHYNHPKFEKLPAESKLENLPIAGPPTDLPPLPTSKTSRPQSPVPNP